MQEFNPKHAGIYITRKCNLRCTYCDVVKTTLNEIDIEQWYQVIETLKHIGIENLTILGGEPTAKDGLVDVVRYILDKTNLELGIVSNGTSSLTVIDQLIECGLQKFSSSIDTISGEGVDEHTILKSKMAMKIFEHIRSKSNIKLTAFFVLSKKSLTEIVPVVKHLSEKNIHTYILPYHYSQDGTKWSTRSYERNEYLALDNVNEEEMENVVQRIIDLKNEGYLVSNSVGYLSGLPSCIRKFAWHCPPWVAEIRIDSDGSLMCCHDFKGVVSPTYTVFDLMDNKKCEDFVKARQKDSAMCSGCYWPGQYHRSL